MNIEIKLYLIFTLLIEYQFIYAYNTMEICIYILYTFNPNMLLFNILAKFLMYSGVNWSFYSSKINLEYWGYLSYDDRIGGQFVIRKKQRHNVF